MNTPLLPSNITLNLSQNQSSGNPSQEPLNIGGNTRALDISGSISPASTDENVTIYVNGGSSYNYFTTVTDDAGGYMLTWNFTSAGTYNITASWSGNSIYAGADSETLTVFVGPESYLQFQSPGYNYIFGQASLASYATLPIQGVEDFLSVSIGTVVSFSYDFTILQCGQTVSNVQTQTITIPATEQTIRLGRDSQPTTIQIPAETITVPTNVPPDLSPLMLPDGFNQTINNQFCFILQNSGGNYSLNANALSDDEISDTMQNSACNTAFINASANINENAWYNVSESISDNRITANFYNTNGTLIKTMATSFNATGNNEAILLITNNVDTAMIFKDLTVNAISGATTPTPESNGKATSESGLLFLFVGLSILLAGVFSVTLVFARKKRQMKQKNQINGTPNSDTIANQV